MLNQKQFGCLKFLSVNFNDTQLENSKAKIFSVCKAKISRQINDIRDTGPDTENTDHGPDMGFYGPLVNQSESVENFEKPYNNTQYSAKQYPAQQYPAHPSNANSSIFNSHGSIDIPVSMATSYPGYFLLYSVHGHLLRKYPGIVWSRVSQNLGGNNKFLLGWVTK